MRHLWKKLYLLPVFAFVLILAGCSESPAPAKKEAKKAAEPVTGQSALWKMYQVARTWAPDAQVLKLSSVAVSGVPRIPGKAGAWQVEFTSAEKGRMKSYTYSVVEEEGNLHEGVFGGQEQPWSGPASQPFLIAAVKVDTDAAYKTAEGKAGEYSKKNPGKPITFLLERTPKHTDPAWRVVWGESVGISDFSVYVDASTGAYLETMH